MARISIPSALGNNHGDVVVLFLRAELPNPIDNRRNRGLRRQFSAPPKRFEQARFSEFLSGIVERFGDAIGIERERVPRVKATLPYRAVPILEEPQNRFRGRKPFNGVAAAQKKASEMPAIRVAQAPRLVVVLGKEERGVGALGRILVKELVHRSQEPFWLVQSDRALAA